MQSNHVSFYVWILNLRPISSLFLDPNIIIIFSSDKNKVMFEYLDYVEINLKLDEVL